LITNNPISIQPSFDIENKLLSQDYRIIGGIDEAGRGSLAGPLTIGLVIYSDSFIKKYPHDLEVLKNIKDSKQLTPKKRIESLEIIKKHSKFTYTEMVSHQIIDEININRATEFAIIQLLSKISIKPDVIILDGNFTFNIGIPLISIKKGDTRSISIASASIAAKVTRDKLFEHFDSIYPGYNFQKNKGYGTLEHRKALTEIGVSPIHRKTYQPVQNILQYPNSLLTSENQ